MEDVSVAITQDSLYEKAYCDKTIKGYRVFDLRFADDFDINFMLGNTPDIDIKNSEKLLSFLFQKYGYTGIVDKQGKLSIHSKATEEINIPSSEFFPEKKYLNLKPSKNIEDFGEKIGGAKKDLYQKLEDIIHSFIPDELLQDNSHFKTLPSLDYKKLCQSEIITPNEAALIKYVKEKMPRRPSARSYTFEKNKWLCAANFYKEIFNFILSRQLEPVELRSSLFQMDGIEKSIGSDTDDYINTMIALGFPTENVNILDYRITQNRDTATYRIYRGFYRATQQDNIPSLKEAIDILKSKLTEANSKSSHIEFEIYVDRLTGKYLLGKKIASRKIIHLVEDFNSANEAFNYRANNYGTLLNLFEEKKLTPNEREENNEKRTGNIYRNGNITPEVFTETFNFRGVEFGNWVTPIERQGALNDAFDALMDLSIATGLSTRALSLNGELGLAFGARGSGRFNAHYESANIVINLTRTRGPGSLAHEWWHSLDNYFSRQINNPFDFITANRIGKDGETLREEMTQTALNIARTLKTSPLRSRSAILDAFRTKDYWSTIIEMSARAFECWVNNKLENHNIKNNYLVNFKTLASWVKSPSATALNYPYPIQTEFPDIDNCFSQFFNTIKEKYNPETNKVLLYRNAPNVIDRHVDKGQILSVIQETENELNTKIQKVRDYTHLPQHIQDRIDKNKSYTGVYDPSTDTPYAILDNINSPSEARATLYHEIVAHKGLKALFKDQYIPFLDKVYDSIHPAKRNLLLREYNGKKYIAAEEYIAQIAENYKNPSLWETLINIIRSFCKNIGIDLKISDQDLRFVLQDSKHNLQRINNEKQETTEKSVKLK